MPDWNRRRRAARVVVFDPDDRVLLIHATDPARRNGQWWEIPGGGLDPGEETANAVRRELWEEAGIDNATIGPCVWTQSVSFTFAGWQFDQDEWIHIARCDGTSSGPRGLEPLEAMAFGEQRWWTIDEIVATSLRTIPYRLPEFLPGLLTGTLPEVPFDITPDDGHVANWHRTG